jgi:hypothetical protein
MVINRTKIVYDIETAEDGKRAGPYADSKRIKAPAGWKDQEKIKAREDEKRLELRQKSGLYPWTGTVTTICAMDSEGLHKFYGNNEYKLLSDFGDYITALERRYGRITLIGKNSKNFDQPFLVGRYLAHNLGVPDSLRPTQEPKDIDECFGYSSQSIRGTLSDYAYLLGMKKTSHGSNAQQMYDATALDDSAWKDLVEYCAQDVIITYEFLMRYMKQFQPSIPSEDSTVESAAYNLSPAEIPF